MAAKAKIPARPAIPVFIPELGMFPSARKAALAIVENIKGEVERPLSIAGRVSRAVAAGGGAVCGFLVVRNPAPELAVEEDEGEE